MLKLQVLICAYGAEGLARAAAMHLPAVHGVGYLVSCQSPKPLPVPEALERPDVDVCFADSVGLSNNRNQAMRLASAPYVLFADDDLDFDAHGLKRIIAVFDADDALDLATFICERPGSRAYPPHVHDLNTPYKNYNAVSVEIAARLASLRLAGIWFSPLMGIGAPYLQAGEENMFLHVALAAGLRGRFYPVVISRHEGATTSQRPAASAGFMRATGAYIILHYGLGSGLPRLALKAWRTPGRPLAKLRYLWHLLQGSAYALRHKRALLHPASRPAASPNPAANP